jgi:hypothetical protein
MIAMFSAIMDRALDSHFKKDQSGRLIFIPFSLKRNCYFVDSKSDEEKLRGFVTLFRVPLLLISLLTFPAIYIPALILDNFAGLTPRAHRMAIALGVPLFFWLVLAALVAMLWGLYKKTVPGVTASMTEVGPDVKDQLREISRRSKPAKLAVLLACLGVLLLMIAAILAWHHTLKSSVSPAKVTSGSRVSSIGAPINGNFLASSYTSCNLGTIRIAEQD